MDVRQLQKDIAAVARVYAAHVETEAATCSDAVAACKTLTDSGALETLRVGGFFAGAQDGGHVERFLEIVGTVGMQDHPLSSADPGLLAVIRALVTRDDGGLLLRVQSACANLAQTHGAWTPIEAACRLLVGVREQLEAGGFGTVVSPALEDLHERWSSGCAAVGDGGAPAVDGARALFVVLASFRTLDDQGWRDSIVRVHLTFARFLDPADWEAARELASTRRAAFRFAFEPTVGKGCTSLTDVTSLPMSSR